jgi:hypothetical protein
VEVEVLFEHRLLLKLLAAIEALVFAVVVDEADVFSLGTD